jgi:hypothetical protein
MHHSKHFFAIWFMCRHNNSCRCQHGNVDIVMHNKGDKGDVEIIMVQTHNGLEKKIT